MSREEALQGDRGSPSHLDFPGPFVLESGESLPRVRVAYRTWGTLDPDGANGVLVCHALTGSADADVWWKDLFGSSLDPTSDFIVCSNVLGSCYGTTRASEVSVRDMVRVQMALLDALGVRRLRLVIGGSLGGMQVLEWALLDPERVEAIVPIATSGRHSAWCIALGEAQRQAIRIDPVRGLAAARALAMCTYRSRASFEARFGRRLREPGRFEVESWLHHHGDRLLERFDAGAYVTLTRAMDTHDVSRGRGEYEEVLKSIRVPALVVSIDSDVLYPPEEQIELASLIPNARLATLRSPHGHDAFLIETKELDRMVATFRTLTRLLPPTVETPRGASPQRQHLSENHSRSAVDQAAFPLGGDAPRGVSTVGGQAVGMEGLLLAGPRGRVATAFRHLLASRDDFRLVGVLDRHDDWDRMLDLCSHERPIFVDCTASPVIAGRYEELLSRGIAVVTPNKLANAGRLCDWRRLQELSREVPYRYETTVGAALPVLGTISDLRRAGDRLLGVSAVLSGTLSFVLHRVESGMPFSLAVREAYERGYTEPHPAEDLSGEDVARKLLILLREAGFGIEREDIAGEPLLPGLPHEPDPEAFLDCLAPWDAVWAERAARARERGERLLYLASFDGTTPRVGVETLPAEHPVARGGPGESVIVYRTERYRELPLTISGPGAGPEVTATGVMSDLLRAAAHRRQHLPHRRVHPHQHGARDQEVTDVELLHAG
jgi:homoserine O-acetyltransferase